ncbi:MAG: type II secretion system protein GspN [Bdellovibrionaceae bacterium]|nr:type II secretion system protein GspN [Pseudobdellovibrionaceae bacterium]
MGAIKNIFLHHKSKIFLCFALIFAFVVVFFPYDDLGDTVTSLVANNTGNTIYVQFDDLSLGFLPQPGIKMSNVFIETPFASEIKADTLKVAPSILAVFTGKPLMRAIAENLFSGNLDVSLSNSNKIKADQAVAADIEFLDFNLNDLVKAFVPFPMKANGTASLNALVDIDLEMKSQPEGNVSLISPKLSVPAFSFETNTNGIKQSMAIPTLNLGKVQIKGQLKNGKVLFTDTVIGSAKDDVFAKIGGDIDLRIAPNNVVVSYYNLAIDLTLKETFIKNLGPYGLLVDGMIGKFKSKSLDGTRYAFRLQFNPFNDAFPNFAPY